VRCAAYNDAAAPRQAHRADSAAALLRMRGAAGAQPGGLGTGRPPDGAAAPDGRPAPAAAPPADGVPSAAEAPSGAVAARTSAAAAAGPRALELRLRRGAICGRAARPAAGMRLRARHRLRTRLQLRAWPCRRTLHRRRPDRWPGHPTEIAAAPLRAAYRPRPAGCGRGDGRADCQVPAAGRSSHRAPAAFGVPGRDRAGPGSGTRPGVWPGRTLPGAGPAAGADRDRRLRGRTRRAGCARPAAAGGSGQNAGRSLHPARRIMSARRAADGGSPGANAGRTAAAPGPPGRCRPPGPRLPGGIDGGRRLMMLAITFLLWMLANRKRLCARAHIDRRRI